MKITNIQGLPEVLVKLAGQDARKPEKGKYHVTELLKPVSLQVLERRYYDDAKEDASDCVNRLLGSGVHKIMEEAGIEEGNVATEYPFEVKVGEDIVQGKVDMYEYGTKKIVDWKTTSVMKWKAKDFEDYREQGMMYAWGLSEKGFEVSGCQFVLFLKDWSKSRAKTDPEYPQSAVQVYEFAVSPTDLIDTGEKIKGKLALIHEAEKDGVQGCSEEERWNGGDRYAVGKGNGFKRALKVFDKKEEAEAFAKTGEGYTIDVRKGEDRRCDDYCLVRMWCPFYLSKMKGAEKNGSD